MSNLSEKKCVPCSGGTPKLEPSRIQTLVREIPGWEVEGQKLHRRFQFKSFMDSIRFVQKMADLAEAQDHPPNFCVNFREVEVYFWTHAIGGLSENDFIMAAKVDDLA